MPSSEERPGGAGARRRDGSAPPWVPRRRPGIPSHALDGDLVLHVPDSGRVHVLNPTAAQVWALCDGTRSADAIARELAAAHGLGRARALGDVRDILAEFRRGGLLAAP